MNKIFQLKKLVSITFFFFCTTITYAQTWNGSTNTDWLTPANWTPATLPTSSSEVIIPSGTPNNPTIAFTGSTIEINKLTINTGAILTIEGELIIDGTATGDAVTNNGTLNLNSIGTLSISAATANGLVNAGMIVNFGKINIGMDALITGMPKLGSKGLYNTGMIINEADGDILIIGTNADGLENTSSGNITNIGGLFIDMTANDGILNTGIFINSGFLSIGDFFENFSGNPTGTTQDGFQNEGSFSNHLGDVSISNTGGRGIYNVSGATGFYNNGVIDIYNTIDYGIFNDDDNFTNAFDILIDNDVLDHGLLLGNDLTVNIEGPMIEPLIGYGIIDVSGIVNLNGQDLILTGTYVPTSGDFFTLIEHHGTAPISGTFNGLPEGATITFNGVVLYISYLAGGGNDVNLTLVNPLPVELMTFTAKAQENQTNILEWQTASEENNERFEIEKSVDGQSWKKIGTVEGNGTSFDVSNYHFIDENPFENINYYRLKQTDFDGQFEYSNIINIQAIEQSNNQITENSGQGINFYPNPVQDNLTIEEGQGIITIYNMLGQPVLEITNDKLQVTIDVSHLPQGQYFISILKENGNRITDKITK